MNARHSGGTRDSTSPDMHIHPRIKAGAIEHLFAPHSIRTRALHPKGISLSFFRVCVGLLHKRRSEPNRIYLASFFPSKNSTKQRLFVGTRVQSIPPPRPLTAYKATSSTLCDMEIGGGASCVAGDPCLLVFEPVKLGRRGLPL